MSRYRHLRFIVYTGDSATKDEILATARQRFGIAVPRPAEVQFVFLRRRKWVEAAPYPFLTLLGQSLGSLILAFEAMMICVPDVFIDTMG